MSVGKPTFPLESMGSGRHRSQMRNDWRTFERRIGTETGDTAICRWCEVDKLGAEINVITMLGDFDTAQGFPRIDAWK